MIFWSIPVILVLWIFLDHEYNTPRCPKCNRPFHIKNVGHMGKFEERICYRCPKEIIIK